jgi:hypothetical protein
MIAPIEQDGWRLIHTETQAPVKAGDVTVEGYRIKGGRPPHKAASSGFVWIDPAESANGSSELYAHVCGCCWVHPTLRPLQKVNDQ